MMQAQITDAGVAALTAGGGSPVTLSVAKLGAGYNYIPAASDTDLHGSVIWTSVPSDPVAQNANIVRYSVYLDYSVGNFEFGEIGLYMANGQLFALAANDTLLGKYSQDSSSTPNSMRLDLYLSMVGDNYDIWLNLVESDNKYTIPRLQSPDQLPQSVGATPNICVITSAGNDQVSTLAFTDRSGLWYFDAYAYANQFSGVVVGATNTYVEIALASFSSDYSPTYLGQLILEFASGPNYGICRYITSTQVSGSVVRLKFATPMAVLPDAGDTFIVFSRQPLSNSNITLPIASPTLLGGVMIGATLTIDSNGLLNVYPAGLVGSMVTSVNGSTGDITINATNLPGLSAVGKSGTYADLLGKPSVFTPPVASALVLGGVKIPSGGSLAVAPDGTLTLSFTPVTSVNGATGDVTIPASYGLVNPLPLTSTSDLNAITNVGLYYITSDTDASTISNGPWVLKGGTLEILPVVAAPDTTDILQRWTDATGTAWRRLSGGTTWGSWISPVLSIGLATTSAPGLVQVDAGLSIAAGKLSTNIRTVNGQDGLSTGGAVLITLADLGGIPSTLIGDPNGVAGPLNAAPGATDLSTAYVYGRMPEKQLPIGAYVIRGVWDATTNTATITNDTWPGGVATTYTVSLAAGGEMTIDWTDTSSVAQSITVDGSGSVFVVGTAGTTAIDGIGSWYAGDTVSSASGAWHRNATAETATTDATFAANTDRPASSGWIRAAFSSILSAVLTAAGFEASIGANGYVKMPSLLGGWLLQWGSATLTAGTNTLTWPTPFDTCYAAIATETFATAGTDGPNYFSASIGEYTAADAKVSLGYRDGATSGTGTATAVAGKISWIAIGKW